LDCIDLSTGWIEVPELLQSRKYDLLALSGLGDLLTAGAKGSSQIWDWVADASKGGVHLIITGQRAPADLANVATSIVLLDRPSSNTPQVPGIDY
jgi:hypothetical protein